MTNNGGPGPGWYPDPERPGQQRWWDGTAWEKSSPPTEEQPAVAPSGAEAAAATKGPGGSGSNSGLIAAAVVGVVVVGLAAVAVAGLALFRTGSSKDDSALVATGPVETPATPLTTTTTGAALTTSVPTSVPTTTTTTTTTTATSTVSATSTDPTTTTTTAPTTTTSQAETQGQILEPGNVGVFTSPSGNIACNMSVESGASCWISEKQWEIDQPTDDEFCEIADWGNAIDVDHTGVRWPCYTDMGWPITADPLQYGDRMRVGDYECASAENGVTCLNGEGRGFRLARSAVTQF